MITKYLFDKSKDNKDIYSYVIEDGDLKVEILNYGATIKDIFYKGRDVILGYSDVKSYEENGGCLGATIGRYANRIKDGRLVIGDNIYNLTKNEKNNHIHGGFVGFDKKIWSVDIKDNKLIMSLKLSDMEENYPGNLDVKVIFYIEDNGLYISYYAISDKDTVCNFTNHSYFNLDGEESKNILSHKLKLNADYYTPVDNELISTGEILSVKDTPFDFTSFKEIGKDIKSDDPVILSCKGYDTNFCLNKDLNNYAGTLKGKDITMDFYTDMPGVQVYTSNFLNVMGRNNIFYGENKGVCLETQFYPDSPNKNHFPSPILKKGEEYRKITIYKFS